MDQIDLKHCSVQSPGISVKLFLGILFISSYCTFLLHTKKKEEEEEKKSNVTRQKNRQPH